VERRVFGWVKIPKQAVRGSWTWTGNPGESTAKVLSEIFGPIGTDFGRTAGEVEESETSEKELLAPPPPPHNSSISPQHAGSSNSVPNARDVHSALDSPMLFHVDYDEHSRVSTRRTSGTKDEGHDGLGQSAVENSQPAQIRENEGEADHEKLQRLRLDRP
jgi:hypothetical protein